MFGSRGLIFTLVIMFFLNLTPVCGHPLDVKDPEFSGLFYPADPAELTALVDALIEGASLFPQFKEREACALVVPHAGYVYSGATAACAYKAIKDKQVRTVVILASSHHHSLKGACVYPQGCLRTPLGTCEIDNDFVRELKGRSGDLSFGSSVFSGEHPIEVQLPFLQRLFPSCKVVPVVMGECDLESCRSIASALKATIGGRNDVLIVASSDMYHGYDWEEAGKVDAGTLAVLKQCSPEELYGSLRSGNAQMCGGLPVVVAMMICGNGKKAALEVLQYTNSAAVTGDRKKGVWTVGYSACIISTEGRSGMLTTQERKMLLDIARSSIAGYLKTGKKTDIPEPSSTALRQPTGVFVTLRKGADLRGCIGSLVGERPLYLAVQDMAVESAVKDPRFMPLTLPELEGVKIEVSVLSPLEKVDSIERIKLGEHGVIVRKGMRSGVYLPQVAEETGWNKEEFLSSLCAHKAGLSPDAWKQKDTELYIFTAEVFSENDF